MKINSKKAFTLIELLVVIAIIALLSTILMPALRKAKSQAENVVCRNNMKTYGIVISTYLQDYDGRFPDSYTTIFSSAQIVDIKNKVGNNLITAISRYEKATGITLQPAGSLMPYLSGVGKSNVCPSFAKKYRKEKQETVSYSYSFNWWLNDPLNFISREGMVTLPAGTFWAGEESLWIAYYKNTSGQLEQVNKWIVNDNSLVPAGISNIDTIKSFNKESFPPYSGSYTDSFGDFHKRDAYKSSQQKQPSGGSSNAVCLDGHVEEVTPVETFQYAKGI